MFDHVTIRVSDRETSERFYSPLLGTLGYEKTYSDKEFCEWDDFSLSGWSPGKPVTRRLHVGFAAARRELVDEFWRVATEAGYASDGEPGARPEYGNDYYGSFVLDPDGNSIEAVHHGSLREDGAIDHLWIRVADLDASRAFYELVAPYGGFREESRPGRAQFAGASGSFSLVPGEKTDPVHVAFPTDDNAVVDAFHAALVEAGYRSNGAPGERRKYHEGYYGAFVYDPDGHNIEVVNHNR